jgi:hypothetical protein
MPSGAPILDWHLYLSDHQSARSGSVPGSGSGARLGDAIADTRPGFYGGGFAQFAA